MGHGARRPAGVPVLTDSSPKAVAQRGIYGVDSRLRYHSALAPRPVVAGSGGALRQVVAQSGTARPDSALSYHSGKVAAQSGTARPDSALSYHLPAPVRPGKILENFGSKDWHSVWVSAK